MGRFLQVGASNMEETSIVIAQATLMTNDVYKVV